MISAEDAARMEGGARVLVESAAQRRQEIDAAYERGLGDAAPGVIAWAAGAASGALVALLVVWLF